MAVTVHLLVDAKPTSIVLDIHELPRSHSGENMAEAFAKILTEYGIKDKVSWCYETGRLLTHLCRLWL
jgi:hypothetical protein